MKSKKKQRILALILSMVLMLSASISALAEGDVPTEAYGTETVESQASAQSLGEEAVPETEVPAQETGINNQSAETSEESVQETSDVSGEIQEVPAETTEPSQEVSEETAETTQEVTEAPTDITQSETESVETEEETAAEEITAEEVVSEAAELFPVFETEYTTEDGSAIIYANADEGVFPEGTTLYAERITEEAENYNSVVESLDAEAAKDGNVVLDFVAYDISFYDSLGNEIEPNGNVNISMVFNELDLEANSEEDSNLHVVHINADSETEKVEGNIGIEGTNLQSAEFTTDQFSIYAITSSGMEVREDATIEAGDYAVVEFWDKDTSNGNADIEFTNTGTSSDSARNIRIEVFLNGDRVYQSRMLRLNMSDTAYDSVNLQTTVKPGDGYYLDHCLWQKSGGESDTFGGSGSTGMNTGNNILRIYLTNNTGNQCTTKITGTKNISVDLYNYDSDAYNNHVGINSGSLLLRSSWTEGYKADNYNITGDNRHNISCGSTGIYYGLAHMENGNIVFNKNAAFFDNNFNSSVGTKYSDVDFEFIYNEDTYEYSYDSTQNHVHFDESTNTISQYVGTGPNVLSDGSDTTKSGFFPFTDEDDNMTDYGFGMRMDVDFLLTEGGKLPNGQDMTFSFSGDDDVWVFIDGNLVLDLGGLHARRGGTINFATGTVTYDNTSSGPVTSASDAAQPDTSFDLEPGTHTLTMYYLERGGNDSNCEIKFNLLVVDREGTLEFNKVDENGTALSGADFGLYDTNEIGTDTTPIATSTSDSEGKVLFDISGLSSEQTYYIKEINPPFGYIADETVYPVTISESSSDNGTTIKVEGTISGMTQNRVVNEKYTQTGGKTVVTVNKTWEDGLTKQPISVTLYADGERLTEDKYTVTLNENNNWSHTWNDLPGDTIYTVVENDVPDYIEVEYSQSSVYSIAGDSYRITPCNTFKYTLGENSVVIIFSGSEYHVWTPVTIEDANDENSAFYNVLNEIKGNPGPSISSSNTTFYTGDNVSAGFKEDDDIQFTYDDATREISVNYVASKAWSWFCIGNYNKTTTIKVDNKINTTAVFDIPVNKNWTDGNENHVNDKVTVQLYKKNVNGEDVEVVGSDGKSVALELSAPDWRETFEDLLYWDTETKKPIEYTVKETFINETPVDSNGQAEDYQSSVTKNSDGSFTVTNSLSKVAIDLQKYGTDYFTGQISGASFALYSGEKSEQSIEWNTSTPIRENIDVSADNLKELELEPGYYYLEETTAPEGYQILGENIYFFIGSDGSLSLINEDGSPYDASGENAMWRIPEETNNTIQIKNKTLYSLPSSGGPGIFLYMIGGTLLLIAGSLMIYINRRRGVLRR